jgi:hypothetical protein
MDDHNGIIERVKELTGGKFLRPRDRGGRQAMAARPRRRAHRERGKLIVAGYHQDGPRQVNMWLWNWRGST